MRRRAKRLRQCWDALEKLGLKIDDPLMQLIAEANDAECNLARWCEKLSGPVHGYRPLMTRSYKTNGLASKERPDFKAKGIRRG